MEVVELLSKDKSKILELENHSAPEKPFYSKYNDEALDFIFNNPNNCKAFGIYEGSALIGWDAIVLNGKMKI